MSDDAPAPIIDFTSATPRSDVPACRESWRTLPPPSRVEMIGTSFRLTLTTAERIRGGHVPESMDDRWFIFADEDQVFFHRSWSGACIFGAKLADVPMGAELREAWVTRDPEQYGSADLDADSRLFAKLIEFYFGGD